MEALAEVHHPGVAAPLDSGSTPGGHPYVVMEYVPGKTLRSLITTEGALPQERVLGLKGGLASALFRVHQLGIWHLDVKPEHIIVRAAGEAGEQAAG